MLIPVSNEGTEYPKWFSEAEQIQLKKFFDKTNIFILQTDLYPRGRNHPELRSLADKALFFVNYYNIKYFDSVDKFAEEEAFNEVFEYMRRVYPGKHFIILNHYFINELRTYVSANETLAAANKALTEILNNRKLIDS